jgi:hypothetical protein
MSMNPMTRTTLYIHASLLAALTLVSHASGAADLGRPLEQKAVQKTNGSLGLVASDSDTKDSFRCIVVWRVLAVHSTH